MPSALLSDIWDSLLQQTTRVTLEEVWDLS